MVSFGSVSTALAWRQRWPRASLAGAWSRASCSCGPGWWVPCTCAHTHARTHSHARTHVYTHTIHTFMQHTHNTLRITTPLLLCAKTSFFATITHARTHARTHACMHARVHIYSRVCHHCLTRGSHAVYVHNGAVAGVVQHGQTIVVDNNASWWSIGVQTRIAGMQFAVQRQHTYIHNRSARSKIVAELYYRVAAQVTETETGRTHT